MSAPPYLTPEDLWRAALADLEKQMSKATYHAWLADSRVLVEVSTPDILVILVRNQYAQAWLMHQLQPVIARTLDYIAGHRVDFYFIPKSYTKEVAGNPLEERLQECASTSLTTDLPQFDAEPAIAPSPKHRAYLEPLLPRAGIVPTRPIGLPANIPSELLNTLLIEGDDSMTDPSAPTHVRIYSHITQSRFLHIEDTLNIGKARIFAGTYRKGQGMGASANAFVDIADARVIFGTLVLGEEGFTYKEYKGTPPQNGSPAVSRVLSIAVKGENVYIELKTGPGKLTNTGAITPNGKPEVEVNVHFNLYEARRMAASVLAYIHAWDVMRMMCHHGVMADQEMVSRPAPYLLVPATSAANGVQVTPASEAPRPDGAVRPSAVAAADNGRPVTRKDPVPKAKRVAAKRPNGRPAKPNTAAIQLLKYGDGSMVDGQNLTEVQTFQQYAAEKKAVPKSKAVLLDYYRQRVQAPASAAD
jgi:hypothetical protein